MNGVWCSPPAPPVKCDTTGCTVSNAYGIFPDRWTCSAAAAIFPSSEEELLEAVATGSRKKQKMRVVTRWSHSIPKLVCPGGEEGLIISTQELKRVVSVDEESMRMSVESGAALGDIISAAAEYKLALPQTPYWKGLTIGGLISTGAHGSSLFGKGSAVHEYVVGMRLVVPLRGGNASVVTFNSSHADLDAAKVSLGLLGGISQVTLQLQAMFKRSITNVRRDEQDLEESITEFGRTHEFGDLTWYPGQRKIVYRIDDRVPVNQSGDGVNDFIGFRQTLTAGLAITRLAEEMQEATKDAKGKCMTAKLQVEALEIIGSGFKNNDLGFVKYPIVGYQNKLQAAGSCLNSTEDLLLTACPWDPRIKGEFFHQTTMKINMTKISDFITDIKRLRDLNPSGSCGVELYNGILMRFVKASSAYLGANEDSVDLDFTYYRSKDPMVPRLDEDMLEEIEQMGLFKYGGTPHWGKNRNIAFQGVLKKYKKGEDFLKAMKKYDPEGLFSNEWTDGMLGIGKSKGVVIDKDGCALEGLCLCAGDRNCAPHKGYFCRAGRVYVYARVCRYEV
ncbi:probable L-gulonolactone oxidase 6 [Cryptomeria japonica]|uniref:probable L-gulonolactone oxidase 6 n=1 Tax=Cryptomeria japonica TaxID=3369 RepID=UPI0027D9EA11|nr:probable L-gulonolactone oxidase 6 [Cryptomeria japonica]